MDVFTRTRQQETFFHSQVVAAAVLTDNSVAVSDTSLHYTQTYALLAFTKRSTTAHTAF